MFRRPRADVPTQCVGQVGVGQVAAIQSAIGGGGGDDIRTVRRRKPRQPHPPLGWRIEGDRAGRRTTPKALDKGDAKVAGKRRAGHQGPQKSRHIALVRPVARAGAADRQNMHPSRPSAGIPRPRLHRRDVTVPARGMGVQQSHRPASPVPARAMTQCSNNEGMLCRRSAMHRFQREWPDRARLTGDAEQAPKSEIFARPRHPYPQALLDTQAPLAATPSVDPAHRQRTAAVRGELPSPLNPPPDCALASRCPHATALHGGTAGIPEDRGASGGVPLRGAGGVGTNVLRRRKLAIFAITVES
jgi:oligopeptide/dipeptide ABC transporter ATP-binding protein